MFNNISGKLKTVAKIFIWIGITGSIIVGIILIVNGARINSVYIRLNDTIRPGTALIYYGLCVIPFGSFVSWLSGISIYGFGELIEKASESSEGINMLLRYTEKTNSEITTNGNAYEVRLVDENKKDNYPHTVKTRVETEYSTRYTRTICSKCGQELYLLKDSTGEDKPRKCPHCGVNISVKD